MKQETLNKGVQQKFIIGYSNDINVTESLMQFKDEADADFRAEEWVTVYADTLKEAFDKYQEAFEAWHKEQSKIHPKLSKHTKGHYWIEESNEDFDKIFIWCDNGELESLLICQMDSDTPEDLANAKRIVTAVNCFDEMLEVLENAKNALQYFQDEQELEVDETYGKINSLLAKLNNQ